MMSDKAEKMLPNILKVRDDHQPVRFEKAAEDGRFKICEGFDASWAGEEFGPKELRGRIEPWLTALFQSEHLSLLAGSGLTHAVHYLAAGKGAADMGALALSNHQAKIDQAAEKAAEAAGRKKGNLEDQLRVANELLRGLEILKQDREAKALCNELRTGMQTFAQSILSSEAGIATAEEGKLAEEDPEKLLRLPATTQTASLLNAPDATLLADVEARKTALLRDVNERNLGYFEQEVQKLDAWADDLKLGLEQEIKEIDREIKEVRRTAAISPTLEEKLSWQKKQRELEGKRSKLRRELFARQDDIEMQHNTLSENLEEQVKQRVQEQVMFNVEWALR